MDRRLLELDLKTSLSALKDLMMPRVCIVCGRTLMLRERHLCTCCLADLPRTRLAGMARNPMADQYNAILASHETGFEPYAHASALFYYKEDAEYRRIPQSLKYLRNFGAGRHFASMLGSELARSEIFRDVDVVIPVPLHWTRRLRRGYNQAEVIAREVASQLGARALCGRRNVLRRRRRTHTQISLGVEEKARNVENAFLARPCTASHILLVDDVFTTGSTISACHLALRKVVPASTRISVATLAAVQKD